LPGKEELVKRISETLEVKLESLDRMTKEDLEKLAEALADPSNLIRVAVKQVRGKAREELTRPLRELLDRPLIDLLERRGVSGEGGGPLGFGVIPNILGKRGLNKQGGESVEKT